MFVVVPMYWKIDLPEEIIIFRRESPDDALCSIRDALAGGERSFLICADGAADEAGWLVATDHVRLFGSGPLIGPNRDDLGPRFPSLNDLYLAPEGCWEKGVVCNVPDWRLATRAELKFYKASALVSSGINEAVVAGHGEGKVLFLVRCHDWNGSMPDEFPLREILTFFERKYLEMPVERAKGGEE